MYQLFFCLLPDKSSETYYNVFLLLSNKCKAFGLNFKPIEIVVDFELSIHNAIYKYFGRDLILLGCKFHLCQAWFRKIQEYNLVPEYKEENSVIGRYLKLHFGMMYLSSEEVVDFFNEELHYLLPNDKRVLN